jgi:GDPmannose 4,6-dehydratase
MGPNLIIGNRGQDGSLLARYFDTANIPWIGVNRSGTCDGSFASVAERISLLEYEALGRFVARMRPSAIFYLAAHHRSSEESSEQRDADIALTKAIHCDALGVCLDTIVRSGFDCHLFYASSSLIFDGSDGVRQNEDTAMRPQGLYGQSKLEGMQLCRDFRLRHGVRASCGILYNHESHLRSARFLSRKVVDAALRARRGASVKLSIGDLRAATDWGYAPDFIDAFVRIANLKQSGDYIVATDRLHTVEDWLHTAFGRVSLDWRSYVELDETLLKRKVPPKQGDYRRLNSATGWRPFTEFDEMVDKIMNALSQ